MSSDDPRFIVEPPLLARIRRIKDVWRAFRFLLNGGKFRVVVDCVGLDPRIHRDAGQKVFVWNDGQVIRVADHVSNAMASSLSKRLGPDLTLAKDDDPDGFRVKWTRDPSGWMPVYGNDNR
jgi:hypothetical protein